MNSDKLLPQHDLDERNSLGRATPAEWSTFVSGRASITEAGREALIRDRLPTLRERADNAYALAWQLKSEGYDLSKPDWLTEAIRRTNYGRVSK